MNYPMAKAQAAELAKELFLAGVSFSVNERAADDWVRLGDSLVAQAKLHAAARPDTRSG